MTFTCPNCKTERTSLDCGQCLAQKLVDMHDAQKKRADEAVELLKELTWTDDEDGYCIDCGSYVGDATHADDCRLAALIGKAGA